MRALGCGVAILLVLGLATAASAGHHEKAAALKEEVTRIGDDLAAAMMANDYDKMLAMYAPDAISLPNYGTRMQGMDEFRQHQEMMQASGMKVLAFESDPTDVWDAGKNVIEIGRYKIALDMPGMGEIEDVGKYVTIYERDGDGALKIVVETWNTDMNPMAMMGGMPGGSQEGEPHAPPAEEREEPADQDQEP